VAPSLFPFPFLVDSYVTIPVSSNKRRRLRLQIDRPPIRFPTVLSRTGGCLPP
jgi:hypothetical protein